MAVELTDSEYTENTTPPDHMATEDPGQWKQCPLCAETIRAAAIKCRFCGEYLEPARFRKSKSNSLPWQQRTSTIVVALLVVGPLALPLVWVNPRYKIVTRVWVTIVVLAATVLLIQLTAMVYRNLMDQIQALGGM